MADLNIGASLNTVTTLANLPVDKGTIYAMLSSATQLSLNEPMKEGQNIKIVINPTDNFTQPLPTSGGWHSMSGASVKMFTGERYVLTISCVGEGSYVISSVEQTQNKEYIDYDALLGGYSIIEFGKDSNGYNVVAGATASGGTVSNAYPSMSSSVGNRAYYAIVGNDVKSLVSTFHGMTSLTGVTLGNSLITIGQSTFNACRSLKTITIPDSVTTIGQTAFGECTGLTSITWGQNVSSIGLYAFTRCLSLTSVTIPNSVTSIEASAFSGCTGLASVVFDNSPVTLGNTVFSGCTSLTSVDLGNSIVELGSNVFNKCTALKSITYNDVAYTSKNALVSALKSNGCTVSSVSFSGSGLGT